MNKELYRIKINKKIVDIKQTDKEGEEIIIVLEDEKEIKISAYHSQDCCENVYAEFNVIKYQKEDIIGKEYKELVIKSVDELGFILCFYRDWEESEKVFIPCYNEQNGYYSSELELIINYDGVKTKIDITEYVEDHIN